jgi:hypothetical protein
MVIFIGRKKGGREKMRGKKIFGIGAAVLLVTLAFSSAVTSESENEFTEEIIQAISEILENNSEDLETIGDFLLDTASDYNSGQPIANLTNEMDVKINNQKMNIQPIVENIFNESNLTVYAGKNAYWVSVGIWQFYIDQGDYNFYFGHCWAFSKQVVGFICDLFLKELPFAVMLVILFIILCIIFDILTAILLIVIIILFYDMIVRIFENAKSCPYGLVLFYFDRVDKIHWIYNKIMGACQPEDPDWDPTYFFPGTEWRQVI